MDRTNSAMLQNPKDDQASGKIVEQTRHLRKKCKSNAQGEK